MPRQLPSAGSQTLPPLMKSAASPPPSCSASIWRIITRVCIVDPSKIVLRCNPAAVAVWHGRRSLADGNPDVSIIRRMSVPAETQSPRTSSERDVFWRSSFGDWSRHKRSRQIASASKGDRGISKLLASIDGKLDIAAARSLS